MTIVQLQTRLAAGDPVAKREIEAAVVARRGEKGEHTAWGLLCEQAGLLSLAFTEFQLALRDDRDDETAALHLAQHYRERGDAERAMKLLERLLSRDGVRVEWLEAYFELLAAEGALPRLRDAIARAEQQGLPRDAAEAWRRRWLPARAPAGAGAGAAQASRGRPAPEPAEPAFAPTDSDAIRMHTLFAGREDVHARQWARPDGETGYTPIHEPLTPNTIKQHFNGQFTIGVYPVRLDGTVTFFAVDLDIDRSALQRARGDTVFAQELRATLAAEGPRLLKVLIGLGFKPLFENSGYKGRHFWVFLAEPAAAAVAHLLGRMFVAWQSPQLPPGLHLEFFPKQASLTGKGLGNLIKLPLGIHRRTGRRSLFLDEASQPLADQLAALRAVERLSRGALYSAVERLKGLAPGGAAAAEPVAPWEGPAELAPAGPKPVAAPAPPARPAVWTEADFEADPRVRHLLAECPVLAELKRAVDEHRRLTHEEQLVLIHSLGHVDGGPQAVNYLLTKCVDVGPEKLMKDRLKGNPVSCPSIRKKIPHVTRRVPCNCPFEFASDRYPTPVLHLLTLAGDPLPPRPEPSADEVALAQRFGVLERRRAELDREWSELHAALIAAVAALPGRELACPGGRYRVEEHDGVEQLTWVAEG
jgi:tetratricopeptide (TPR) repeat protein